jgi:signal transduction histidine kinase
LSEVQDDRARRYLDLALSQAGLLGEVAQDMADVIRVQSGQLPIDREPLELGRLVEETVELAGPLSQGQQIRLQRAHGELIISGDRRRLQQALLNLLSNAFELGAGDGGVDVEMTSADGAAVVEIVNHGPGIADEERQRMFERLYQADHDPGRRLGVGLFLTHAIITGHEGSLQARDTQPHGTTFIVRLPLMA